MKSSKNPVSNNCGRRAWAVIACVGLGFAGLISVANAEGLAPGAAAQISALQQEKATRTPAQLKMDSQLVYALKQSRNQPIAPGVPRLALCLTPDAGGHVAVDLTANLNQDLLDFIIRSGGTVLSSVPKFNAVRAKFPLNAIESLAARPDVTFVEPAVPVMRQTGSVNSQGDTTHQAGQARTVFSVDGTGTSIGVISDSVDYLARSQSTGDLPQDVTVLPGQSGIPGSGEGTAMLEIVHDLAPGAKLFFATGGGGPAVFAQNILDLRAAGCDVIVDDLIYLNESPFQDGVIAQAVNTVTADGAMYFSSAANFNNLTHGTSMTWEGDFADGGPVSAPVDSKGGLIHSFGANTYNTITDYGGGLLLFWADPDGASTNDYDLYILDSGNNVLGASTTVQNGQEDPIEGLIGLLTNGMRAVVVKASGDARFMYMSCWGAGKLEIATAGNIRGHMAATNAFGTAACDVARSYPGPFSSTNPVEDFSSDGPRRVFFHANGTPITPGNFSSTGGFVRQKPDIAAADGGSTTVPGFDPFFGTSAAAPHAAAIAGLVKSYNPALTPDEIRTILTSTAIDIEAAGVDRDSGYGIVMALPALQATPPPRVPVLLVSTNYVVGGNGNGVVDVDECNEFYLVLTNVGVVTATNVQVTLSSTNAGVFIPQPTASYSDIATNAAATNLTAFKIGTSPNFLCGTPITLRVQIKALNGSKNLQLQLPTGTNAPPSTFVNFFPAAIPDNSLLGTNTFIMVTNLPGVIRKVTVSVYVSHEYDSDLSFELVGPDGTTVQLAANNGDAGQNFGLSCFPETSRTTFDDDATNSITTGRPPFLGRFQPVEPLSAFVGKHGTNAMGLWRFRAVDSVPLDTGILHCWYLSIYSATCDPGGGQCPGVDLSLGMSATPDPAVVGSNLVYTIIVTNSGPNVGKGVVVTHNLPSGAQFVSAEVSQGGASYAGGVVTCTLGNLGIDNTAEINVKVVPTISGTAFSSASVASTDPELNPLNNAVSTQTIVAPPSCDLAVGLADAPDPTIVGGPLTYTVAVTNQGPATASGVIVTNVLATSMRIDTVAVSQGSSSVAGNVVLFQVGLLPRNGFATATINATPQAYGPITATATAGAIQPDPLLANNTATVTTTVGQAADLAISMTAQPDPVVLGSNVTFNITTTNLGPNVATNVVVSQSLPAGVTVSTVSLSQGTYTLSGSSLICNLGTVIVGGSANARVIVTTTRVGMLNSSATVTSAQTDPFSGNNTATVSAQVAPPFVSIVAAGTTLTAENFYPANGSIEAGETVTIQFRLQNVGNVPNTNLTATLLPGGGVTSPSGPQNYGILRPIGVPGGVPVSRPFTFTAGSTSGLINATLQLQDVASNLPPVTFTFTLPQVFRFANTNPIVIPSFGVADPYPSAITVAGVTGQVGKVTATLSQFSHDYPHDVSVLLVGPSAVKALLLSHAGDRASTYNVDLTFDDTADSALPAMGGLLQGTWKPSAYSPSPVFSNPAPAGPYSSLLSDFNGMAANGVWSLYVIDDNTGDPGLVSGGWSLELTSVTPVNQLADVGISGVAAPNPVLVGDILTYTWTVTNSGPAAATGVTFSNALPASLSLVSASISQGNWTTNENVLLATFGTLPAGASATLVALVQPQVGSPASVANTAWVSAFESDLHTGNNRATIGTTVTLPQVGLSVTMGATPDPVIVGSNLTFTTTITNNGPGNALDVVLVNALPAGAAFVGASVSQGTVANNNGVLHADFDDLLPGATASMQLTVIPQAAGLLTNAAVVDTASSDALPSRSAQSVATVNNPAANVVAAGAILLTEDSIPANGTIDRGETVTVSLALANTGVLDTVNLTATLLPEGGVTSPGAPAVYGVLPRGGSPVWRSFSFTADPGAGPTLTATLRLQDGDKLLGSVVYTFDLPAIAAFSSTATISIPDRGTGLPYPSTITLGGLTGVVGNVTVTLNKLTHSFPGDVSVLLASPGNPEVLLMSHNGGSYSVTNLTLTFDDAAAARLPASGRLISGVYRPSRAGAEVNLPPPAPLAPYSAALSSFVGLNPNGTWALYVLDESTGDPGVIGEGWTLNMTTINPVNPVAEMGVAVAGAPASVPLGTAITYRFVVTNAGPATAASVVLADLLPSGVTILSNSISQGAARLQAGELRFEFGSVAAGAAATASLSVLPGTPGTLVNSASLSGGFTDFNSANNAVQSTTAVVGTQAPILSAQIAGGLLQLNGTGQPGARYAIEASDGLTSWSVISTNTAGTDGTFQYTDPNTAQFGARFYRAVQQVP